MLVSLPFSSALEPIECYSLAMCGSNNPDGSVPSIAGDASMIGTLLPSPSGKAACDRQGVRPTDGFGNQTFRMESTHALTAFQEHFKESGLFSVSIWMTPVPTTHDGVRPILTFGPTNRTLEEGSRTGSSTRQPHECNGYSFRLAQMSSALAVSFSDGQGVCRNLLMYRADLQPNNETHVVITFTNTTMQVYVDGLPLYRRGVLDMTIDIRSWKNAAESTLQLFSNHVDRFAFLGSIGQVVLYDQTLSTSYEAALFALGSTPFQGPSVPFTRAPTTVPTLLPVTSAPSKAPPRVSTRGPRTKPTKPPMELSTDDPTNDQSTPGPVSLKPSMSPTALPSHSKPTLQPTSSPTANPSPMIQDASANSGVGGGLTWQLVTCGAVAATVAFFCVWSICGGWPRFVAHHGKRVDCES
jgi:Concanavalin A-like lectin/glucanases superfamily